MDQTRQTGTPGEPGEEGPDRPADAWGREETAEEATAESRAGRGWPGWSGLSDLQEAVSEVVDSALRGFAPATGRFPRHDLVRVPGEGYRALFDLPGVGKEDLEVTTVGDELTVSGERPRPELPEGSEVLRAERGHGRFRRSIRLPPDVDPAGVKARLDDGVLTVALPRRADSEEQRIEVEG